MEYDGFRLLVDVGFGVVPRLLTDIAASEVDAVFVSHGHPDHCADLSPLLRARTMTADPATVRLPVYCLTGAVDAVLGLDRSGLLDDAYALHELDATAGSVVEIGPFRATTSPLRHSCPNLGLRLEFAGQVLAYTGDTGPCAEVEALARRADLLLADATFVDDAPAGAGRFLGTAALAGEYAAAGEVGRLVLTHLGNDVDRSAASAAALERYVGPVDVAVEGLRISL